VNINFEIFHKRKEKNLTIISRETPRSTSIKLLSLIKFNMKTYTYITFKISHCRKEKKIETRKYF